MLSQDMRWMEHGRFAAYRRMGDSLLIGIYAGNLGQCGPSGAELVVFMMAYRSMCMTGHHWLQNKDSQRSRSQCRRESSARTMRCGSVISAKA